MFRSVFYVFFLRIFICLSLARRIYLSRLPHTPLRITELAVKGRHYPAQFPPRDPPSPLTHSHSLRALKSASEKPHICNWSSVLHSHVTHRMYVYMKSLAKQANSGLLFKCVDENLHLNARAPQWQVSSEYNNNSHPDSHIH